MAKSDGDVSICFPGEERWELWRLKSGRFELADTSIPERWASAVMRSTVRRNDAESARLLITNEADGDTMCVKLLQNAHVRLSGVHMLCFVRYGLVAW